MSAVSHPYPSEPAATRTLTAALGRIPTAARTPLVRTTRNRDIYPTWPTSSPGSGASRCRDAMSSNLCRSAEFEAIDTFRTGTGLSPFHACKYNKRDSKGCSWPLEALIRHRRCPDADARTCATSEESYKAAWPARAISIVGLQLVALVSPINTSPSLHIFIVIPIDRSAQAVICSSL